MTLELRPHQEGAFTEIKLSSSVATAPSAQDVQQLLAILTSWQSCPVRVVLYVAGTDEDICWAQRWDDAMCMVPAHHAEIHLKVRGFPGVIQVGHAR
ncbi:MAG: hypothetical protein SF187_02330 [Deltaproteobacteria bacterium]|nr:hypothetical protein [Deltaproteobacteria bacterium]